MYIKATVMGALLEKLCVELDMVNLLSYMQLMLAKKF
jgi:hypothetical protein